MFLRLVPTAASSELPGAPPADVALADGKLRLLATAADVGGEGQEGGGLFTSVMPSSSVMLLSVSQSSSSSVLSDADLVPAYRVYYSD